MFNKRMNKQRIRPESWWIMANQGEIRANSPWKLKIPWNFHEKTTKKGRNFNCLLLTLFSQKSGFFEKSGINENLPDSGRIRAKSPWFRTSFVHESPWNQGDSGRIRANFALFNRAEQRSKSLGIYAGYYKKSIKS